MADRKATNKYYPPDWDPSKGSINTYRGSHPLRDRARKMDQGILIVRFELPYNIWCNGCGNMVGMGTRYNAEKKEVGKYFSTPILSFRMKCHRCDNWFEIQTDPKNTAYVVVAGAQQKTETWKPEENEGIALPDSKDKEKREQDAMYRLEHGVTEQARAADRQPALGNLKRLADRSRDDYELNKRLRSENRAQRQQAAAAREEEQQFQQQTNVTIPILPLDPRDSLEAAVLAHKRDDSEADTSRRRAAIQGQAVLGASSGRVARATVSSKGFGAAPAPRTSLAGLVRPKQKKGTPLHGRRVAMKGGEGGGGGGGGVARHAAGCWVDHTGATV